MMIEEQKINQVREEFKDHIATLEKHGDITVLKWKRPNSRNYSIRYIMDGSTVSISGDIGYGVFQLTEQATIEKLGKYYLNYFLEKCRAFEFPIYEYDRESFLKEWINNRLKNMTEYKPGFKNKKLESGRLVGEVVEEFLGRHELSNDDQYEYRYMLEENYYEDLEEAFGDIFEWIYGKGPKYPTHGAIRWHEGLKMAYQQLKERGEIE